MSWDPHPTVTRLRTYAPQSIGVFLLRGAGGMPPRERNILSVLWGHADWRTGRTPALSVAQLGELSGTSRPTVHRALRSLRSWGLVEAEQRPGITSSYRLPFVTDRPPPRYQAKSEPAPVRLSKSVPPPRRTTLTARPERLTSSPRSPGIPGGRIPRVDSTHVPEDTIDSAHGQGDLVTQLVDLGISWHSALHWATVHDPETLREAMATTRERATARPTAYLLECLHQWQIHPSGAMQARTRERSYQAMTEIRGELIRELYGGEPDDAQRAVTRAGLDTCLALLHARSGATTHARPLPT